jgi:hypothetical protein
MSALGTPHGSAEQQPASNDNTVLKQAIEDSPRNPKPIRAAKFDKRAISNLKRDDLVFTDKTRKDAKAALVRAIEKVTIDAAPEPPEDENKGKERNYQKSLAIWKKKWEKTEQKLLEDARTTLLQSLGDVFEDLVLPLIEKEYSGKAIYHSLRLRDAELDFVCISENKVEIISAKLNSAAFKPKIDLDHWEKIKNSWDRVENNEPVSGETPPQIPNVMPVVTNIALQDFGHGTSEEMNSDKMMDLLCPGWESTLKETIAKSKQIFSGAS